MFQKNQAQPMGNDNDTIIAALVKVEGDLSSQGNIIVEGEVHGNIKTEHNLRVGEGAKIFANIKAESAFVSGEIQGNLKIKDKLELTSSAKIVGDVETKTIVIAQGGIVHGKCIMLTDEKVKEAKSSSKLVDIAYSLEK